MAKENEITEEKLQANNSQNVALGKFVATGYCFVANAGTALPKNANEKLTEDYKLVGFCGDDGFVFTPEMESEDYKDANGQVVLTEKTSDKETLKFTMIESNDQSYKEYYGPNSVEQGATAKETIVHDKAVDFSPRVWIIEGILNGVTKQRRIIPLGKVVEKGEVTIGAADIIKYPLTLAMQPDEKGDRQIIYNAPLQTN